MYPVASDLLDAVTSARDYAALSDIVVVEESPEYPGELVFQVFDEALNVFYSRYRTWMSPALVLNELFNLPKFVEQLEADGYVLIFGPTSEPILRDVQRWRQPLAIEGYDLYDFQQFALNRARERHDLFFNWDTGAGKSHTSAAGAKMLFDAGLIEQVIFCTVATSKYDQLPFFNTAKLDAVVNDGTKPKRRKVFEEGHQVYILNYERLWVDYEEIAALCRGRRVLFIFDEATKLVTSGKKNLAREAFEKLHRQVAPGSKVWTMTATVVDGNPLRYRDIFSVADPSSPNPLGSQRSFEDRYAAQVFRETRKVKGTKKRYEVVSYDWNLAALSEVRHVVAGRTQTARKSDPGIKHLFKDMPTIVELVQPSKEYLELAEAIVDRAEVALADEESLKPYFDLLRYACNAPAALAHSGHEVALEILDALPHIDVGDTPNPKLEKLNAKLEAIREQGDKTLVFTQWTDLTLHIIADEIEVPKVCHYGTGMTDGDRQLAKQRFQTDPDITCFLTSDAGKRGINMQCARYVIQYEPVYSTDTAHQRASRIHRVDSYLDGLTNYVMITEGTVEERVWQIQSDRREIDAVIQGTQEQLSFGDSERVERARRSEAENWKWMLFGDR